MTTNDSGIPGFRPAFIAVGVVYVVLASSALAGGVGVMRDFCVPEAVLASPFLGDFFSFFYECMAFVGVLIAVFGLTTRGRREQQWVALVFAGSSLLFGLRDLSTSDSQFGNHLYCGRATLVFVYFSFALVGIFGALALLGWWRPARERAAPAPAP